ncbi:hypothetical protein TCT1_08150 [Xenorhabdus sp. TCT-1]|uniref:Transposase n=1 Tax=Xenorhabdus taiwanensis TaxID=3085177 RepID=A0ABN7C0I2_9GAMM|nr:hypothetical protein TCT1_08150 [Xenorhabdus sp. TCT-1]
MVLVAGKATVVTPQQRFEKIGKRMEPLERKKPYAVYVAPKCYGWSYTQLVIYLGKRSSMG